MDLGYKPEPPEPPAKTSGPSEIETRYPSMQLEDDSVDKLKGDHQCCVGDDYIADGVHLRVKEVSDTEYGKRLSFDVLAIDDFEPADGGDDAGESDDSMTGDSAKPKKAPKALRYS